MPDVSYYNAAILHGVLTYLMSPVNPAGFYRFGGTSAGSPQWAALIAITDQKAERRPRLHQHRPVPPVQLGQEVRGVVLRRHEWEQRRDRLDAANNPVSIDGFDAGPGRDATTGLGSPDAVALVKDLIQAANNGDGNAAINGFKPQPHADKPGHGHAGPSLRPP